LKWNYWILFFRWNGIGGGATGFKKIVKGLPRGLKAPFSRGFFIGIEGIQVYNPQSWSNFRGFYA
jgi:hypothetical protein